MKLPELKALAASRGLKGISQLRKSQLIELLSNGANASTPREATSVADKPAAQAPAPAKRPPTPPAVPAVVVPSPRAPSNPRT